MISRAHQQMFHNHNNTFATILLQTFTSLNVVKLRASITTDLDTLLGQIFAGSWCHLDYDEPVAYGFYCTLHSHNTARAFSRHIEVVCDSTRCYFQHILWCWFVQKYATQSRKKRSRWTAGKRKAKNMCIMCIKNEDNVIRLILMQQYIRALTTRVLNQFSY